jgi:hypothetical protein
MSKLKCIVCGSKATAKLAQVSIKARFDCDICNGTGEEYLSDGVYGSCDCLYDCGPWVKCNVCDYCEHVERISTVEANKIKEGMVSIGDAELFIDKNISKIVDVRTKSKAANDN